MASTFDNGLDTAIRIRYIDPSGKAHDIDAAIGDTLMQVATSNAVPGIDGDCGGSCACGTCLIRLDDGHAALLKAPESGERELVAFLGQKGSNLRLGCQIQLTRELDGVTVHVAEPA
ncbi:2Fe-2S iron-sulfur cluster-binding protein [Hydrocarboniphaga sp.]|uniref:2Fe-2S iron-sulfur cluster-binding protein n=1 Tax=Hydrocarboniphaga sp. TaxID=2033016 RepID=UPI003D0A8D99